MHHAGFADHEFLAVCENVIGRREMFIFKTVRFEPYMCVVFKSTHSAHRGFQNFDDGIVFAAACAVVTVGTADNGVAALSQRWQGKGIFELSAGAAQQRSCDFDCFHFIVKFYSSESSGVPR